MTATVNVRNMDAGADRDLLCAAAEAVIRTQNAGTKALQRNIRVGFAKAGRLLFLLEDAGVVAWEGQERRVLVPRSSKLAAVAVLREEMPS